MTGSEPTPFVTLCAADGCGMPFFPGQSWHYHHRLGVYVHPDCAHSLTVRGEDISTHTVTWGILPLPTGSTVTLTIPGDPKMVREALCVAQHAVNQHITSPNLHGAPGVLTALIRECDRHRPLGPDGKHGDRHTPTCGCDDNPLTEQEPTS